MMPCSPATALRSAAVLLAAFSILALHMPAQQVSFPVSDLVRPEARQPASLWLADALAGPDSEPRGRFVGESAFVGENRVSDAPRPFVSAELAAMVDAMTNSEGKVSVGGAVLSAPAEREAQVRAALATIRRLQEEIRYEITLERVTGEATGEILIRGTQSATADRSAVLADVVRKRKLADFDVEIAQGAAIANPIVSNQYVGAGVAVRAHPFADGSSAVVQVVARTAEAGNESTIELGSVSTDKVDRLDIGIGEFAGSAVVARGEPWTQEWNDDQGRRLRLTVRSNWPSIGETWRSRFFWSRMLRQGVPDFSLSETHLTTPALAAGVGDPQVVQLSGLLDRRPADLRLLAEHPAGLTLASAPGARDFLASLRSEVAERFEQITLQVRVLEADTGTVDAPFGPIPQGAQLLADLRGPAIVGMTTCAAGSRIRSYLRDWEAEVAQIARIVDPTIDRVTSGHALQATVFRTDDDVLRARLLCDLQNLVRVDTIEALVAAQSVGNASTGTSVILPREVVRIERPEHRASRFDLDLEVGDDGTAVERRIVRSFTGPGRELVVAVRVTRGG